MKSKEENIEKASNYYISNPSESIRKSFLYPLQIGYFYYLPGYKLYRSNFDSFLLMFIIKGSCIIDYDSHKIPAQENDFVLLDCYREHGYSSENGWEAIWVHFDGNVAPPLYKMAVETLGNVFSLQDPLPIVNRIAKIYELFHHKEPVREILLHKYLSDVLVELTLYSPVRPKEMQRISLVEDIQHYIKEHIQEDLRNDTLAKRAMMSTYHFIRIFKQYSGMTPHEYIINYRISVAKYLLVQTGLSINEISREIGFSSESIFCASFKKIAGVSPTVYRKERRHIV